MWNLYILHRLGMRADLLLAATGLDLVSTFGYAQIGKLAIIIMVFITFESD